jgi:hypothetical protein
MILDIAVWAAATVISVACALYARSFSKKARRKPSHCWVCRRLSRNPRHPAVAAELKRHFQRWETEPTVTRERP